jgi:hypothetical protein
VGKYYHFKDREDDLKEVKETGCRTESERSAAGLGMSGNAVPGSITTIFTIYVSYVYIYNTNNN